MGKIIDKIKWPAFLLVWLMMLSGYFFWNFVQMVWLTIKKTKMAQKLIYSDLVQTWKEKITGRAKIIKLK